MHASLAPDSSLSSRLTYVESSSTTERPRRTAARPRARAGRAAEARRAKAGPTFSEAEQELMEAMQAYKESSGRMFPTWSEVLEVLKALGYQKTA